MVCILGYTVVEPSDEDPVYVSTVQPDAVQCAPPLLTIQGAIKLMKLILRPPAPTLEEIQDEKEEQEWKNKVREKAKKEKEEKAKAQKAAKEKAKADGKG